MGPHWRHFVSKKWLNVRQHHMQIVKSVLRKSGLFLQLQTFMTTKYF